MAQIIVRNLEDDVKARLQRRAARHGRSMEAEVRHILRDAVKGQNQTIAKLGSRIAARFAKNRADHGLAGIARSSSTVGGIR
jgi:plasmid stability protein